MSIVGSFFHISIKKLICCICPEPNDDPLETIVETAEINNILVLPTRPNDTLKNLFPLSNHVKERFNILCVGAEKEYILVRLTDLKLPGCENLENKRYSETMPENIRAILDSIWEQSLAGKSLSFYLVVRGLTYLCHSFPLPLQNGKIVGAICFIRGVQHETASGEYRLSIDGGYKRDVASTTRLDTILSNPTIKIPKRPSI